MASPDSHIEKVFDQLQTELEKITTSNGYHTDVQKVYRKVNEWQSFNKFPSILLLFNKYDEEQYPGRYTRCALDIQLMVKFREAGSNPSQDVQVARFLTDLKYLLYNQNPTLEDSSGNKLVNKIEILEVNSDKGSFAPLHFLAINLQVVFHTGWS